MPNPAFSAFRLDRRYVKSGDQRNGGIESPVTAMRFDSSTLEYQVKFLSRIA